jgi:hypothetical protein
MPDNLKLEFYLLGFIGLMLAFISIIISINISQQEIMLAIGSFMIVLASYVYITLRGTMNKHAKEINKINEKINIHRDISDLKAKVEILFNKMEKRGQVQLADVLIRIIQIVGILIAGYIILKALGVNF